MKVRILKTNNEKPDWNNLKNKSPDPKQPKMKAPILKTNNESPDPKNNKNEGPDPEHK